MLEPSIDTLQEKINSKYTLVTISARRARELQYESNPSDENYSKLKFVSMALHEIKDEELFLKK